MKTSEEGREFIKTLEGFSAEAYPDPGSKDGKPWTIGYGHTGPEVVPGMKITRVQAGQLLNKDLARFEETIRAAVKLPLVQKELDALACFIYNIGQKEFRESTLVRRLNLGKRAEAAEEFLRWNLNDGKVVAGLVKRRAAERALFRGLSHTDALKEGDKAYEVHKQGL